MRHCVWLVLYCLLAGCTAAVSQPSPASPPLELSGVVIGTLVVDRDAVLVDDLRIPPGSRLLLRPGVRIAVRPSDSTKIDPEHLSPLTEILVQGELRSDGTSAAPVKFVPLPSESTAPDGDPLWAGIEVLGGQVEISGTEFSQADTGLLVLGGQASLASSRFSHCRTGLLVQNGGSASLDDVLVEAGETGIFCWSGGRLRIGTARVIDADEEGLYLANSCEAQVDSLALAGNGIGLVSGAAPAGLVFEKNQVDFHQLPEGAP